MKKLPPKSFNAVWRWIQCLVSSMSGENIRELKRLEQVMKYWHDEESSSLLRAKEASICGDYERAAAWLKQSEEARMRCNKDFREPLKTLTGKQDLFADEI